MSRAVLAVVLAVTVAVSAGSPASATADAWPADLSVQCATAGFDSITMIHHVAQVAGSIETCSAVPDGAYFGWVLFGPDQGNKGVIQYEALYTPGASVTEFLDGFTVHDGDRLCVESYYRVNLVCAAFTKVDDDGLVSSPIATDDPSVAGRVRDPRVPISPGPPDPWPGCASCWT